MPEWHRYLVVAEGVGSGEAYFASTSPHPILISVCQVSGAGERASRLVAADVEEFAWSPLPAAVRDERYLWKPTRYRDCKKYISSSVVCKTDAVRAALIKKHSNLPAV
jgi:hypothetical protein